MSDNPHEKIAMVYSDPYAPIAQHLLSPEFADRFVLLRTLDDVAVLAAGRDIPVLTQSGPGLMHRDQAVLSGSGGDFISHVLVGPLGETIVFCRQPPVWDADPAQGRRALLIGPYTAQTPNGLIRVDFDDPVKIPFYGLYPQLIFDDEWPTWQYITRVIDDNSCLDDPGIFRMSTVNYPNGLPGRAAGF
jgi:hypothetical protein